MQLGLVSIIIQYISKAPKQKTSETASPTKFSGKNTSTAIKFVDGLMNFATITSQREMQRPNHQTY